MAQVKVTLEVEFDLAPAALDNTDMLRVNSLVGAIKRELEHGSGGAPTHVVKGSTKVSIVDASPASLKARLQR